MLREDSVFFKFTLVDAHDVVERAHLHGFDDVVLVALDVVFHFLERVDGRFDLIGFGAEALFNLLEGLVLLLEG